MTIDLSALLRERQPRPAAQRGPRPTGPSPYRIEAFAEPDPDTATTAEVFVYDSIDPDPWWGGIAARDFVRDLVALDVDEITVRINSPGGDVYDALAITNALRSHRARIVTVVEGLAASAASIIAMAGDEVVICRNAELMIHDARGACLGTGPEMAEYAVWLNKVSDNLATVYADRAGGTADEWRAAMHAETWYSADEAVEAGLADRVGNPVADTQAAAASEQRRAVARYDGRAAAPAPFIPKASAEAAENERKEGTMPTLKEGLVERLGIPADADDEAVLTALDQALDELTTPGEQEAAPAAATVDPGTVVVDRAQWESTVAAAEEGRAARAHQIREADNRLVQAAIDDGRIPPARAEHWLKALDADREGATATLNSLEKGLIPVAEIGHSVQAQASTEDLGWFDSPRAKEA
ncbi:head maturation protease, ClpP-related [Tsukamurella hominis]|uniref:head maturation protease, ClpP-related n=1 Tax=Tsukamurella hominis TaxID=1970232 RepID=UPI0039E75E7F